MQRVWESEQVCVRARTYVSAEFCCFFFHRQLKQNEVSLKHLEHLIYLSRYGGGGGFSGVLSSLLQ